MIIAAITRIDGIHAISTISQTSMTTILRRHVYTVLNFHKASTNNEDAHSGPARSGPAKEGAAAARDLHGILQVIGGVALPGRPGARVAGGDGRKGRVPRLLDRDGGAGAWITKSTPPRPLTRPCSGRMAGCMRSSTNSVKPRWLDKRGPKAGTNVVSS